MERIKRSETIGYKVRLLHNQIHKNMEAKRMENEDNLTGMQRWTLGFLKDHSDCEVYQKDIEEAFSISRATASNMLGVMERKGLNKACGSLTRRALKTSVLTDKAAALLDGAERDIREMEARLTAGLSEEDVEHLKRCLDQMLQNLDVTIAEDTRCCCKPKQ